MGDLKQTLRRQLKKVRAVYLRLSAARLARRDAMAAEAMSLEKRGNFAGAAAVWRKKLNGSGGGTGAAANARTLNFNIARLETRARHWTVAAHSYLAILAIAPRDARARRGLEVAALHAAREAQGAKRWREACDMWLAFAKVSADHAKVARNMMICARNGAQEAENRGHWEIAVKFWQDCGTIDATSDTGKKALNRSLVYRARAAERDGSLTQAREFWATMLKNYPADIRAKLGLLRTGGNFEGSTRVDAILRSLAEKTRTTASSFYFDVSDIIMYFRSARTPTGIQRITLAVIDAAFADGQDKVGLCAFDHKSGKWKALNIELFLLLVLLSREGSNATDQQWLSAVEEIQNDLAIAAPFVFPASGIVVNLGSPWGIPNYLLAVREAKRQSNIFYAGFVHDIIPLLHPEYCHGETADYYATWLAGIGAHADFTFANAENTRHDFLGALAKVGKAPIPCEVVFPNGSFAADTEVTDGLSEDVQAVIKDSYVLFVGTIEPRKDHLFVLAAWRRLLSELGPARVPTLVVAGSLGWHCEPVVEFVSETNSLDGKLKMLNSVSDVDLQALYRHALYTVYNSHYEGWGLPVTESLSYKKVPVLPRNSSLIESGGKHAIFYETNSEPSFLSAIRDLIAWPETLKRKEQEIVDDPPIRAWRDIFGEIYGKATTAAARATDGARAKRHAIRLGEAYPLRGRAARTNPVRLAVAEATRIGSGWHGIEEWGAWTCEKTAQMEFDIANFDAMPSEPGAKLHLLVGFRGRDEKTRVELTIDDAPVALFDVPPSDWTIRLEFPASAIRDRHVRLALNQDVLTDLSIQTKGVDTRMIGVGVRSFMLCDAKDMTSRIGFLEVETNYLSGGVLF